MSKTTIKNGSVVRCDGEDKTAPNERCEQIFRSNSFAMVVRKQAALDGWGYVPAWQVENGHNGARKHDVCPVHKAIADARAADREATLAAARERKKAEREAEKAADKAARAAEKAARASAKAAEKAARDKRKADHAQRLAELEKRRQEKRERRAKKGAA